MHRGKIIAQILLIFSVANVALAAPAVVRQGYPDPDAAGAASEKRDGSNDESKLTSPVSTGEPLHLPYSGSWADTRARAPLDLFAERRNETEIKIFWCFECYSWRFW